MEVSPSLREAAERKLAKLDPLLDVSGWVDVGFSEEQNPRIAQKYHCEIVAHLKGKRLKVEGSAGEPFGALDRAARKVDRQVRKLRGKRIDRRRRADNHHDGSLAVPGALDADADDGVRARADSPPRIVEVVESDVKPMTPVEAALQVGVSGAEFLLFVNAESGRAAVIYRRSDGDYGLVQAPG